MLDPNQLLDWNEYIKLLVGLFLIVDPFGSVPVYLGLIGDRPASEKRRIAFTAAVAFMGILVIFTFLGEAILELFSIQLGAFQIAGGILLMLMALEMMKQRAPVELTGEPAATAGSAAGVVPVAMPLLAGPGAISLIIVYSHRHESTSHDLLIAAVVVSMTVVVFLALMAAPTIGSLLGETGRSVLERVLGLIVAAIAVEFIADGAIALFPILGTAVGG